MMNTVDNTPEVTVIFRTQKHTQEKNPTQGIKVDKCMISNGFIKILSLHEAIRE